MRLFWKLTKEAAQYKMLYLVAILATLALTAVNLAAPRVLSAMTGLVGQGMDDAMMQAILRLAVILLVLYLARIVFRFMSSYLTHKAAWHLVGDLRDRIYGKLQSLDMGFFHDKQTGDLMSRAINDTRDFELLYAHMIPELITNVVTMVGVFVILLVINWRLALITCFPLPIVMWASLKFSTLVKPYFQENARRVGELSAQLQDSLSGIHEIQSFGQEEYEGGRIHEKNFAQVRSMLAALRASAVFHPTVEFLSSVGSVLVVFFGGLLAVRGQVSVEQIVAFMLYLAMFYTPISGLATLLENLQQSLAGAERVALVLETPSAITDADDAADMGKAKGSIEFENVSFHYEEDSPVLKNVSFSCKPGQMIALVGPTGVGKTTTTELLSRFYDPVQGRVLIDGQDIRHVTVRSLRRNISPVLQDTFLFNGTIAENIAYAKPDATQTEIEAAAKAANIHDDIAAMTDGYQTQVGERGTRLSGGQKQRIAIARAMH
ncbi:MAG: ABC transporter ATP-binding protein, partial [Clostridia bacterium]|nr:ABC transporter ATP-binding protein [Clostridia bacterium]